LAGLNFGEQVTTTINPVAQRDAGNYRLISDFGGSSNGFVKLGVTLDPCGAVPASIINWLGKAESSQYNDKSDTSSSGKVYQLAEGRIGGMGQAISFTINNRTVPWIWSVIEFDSSGNPTYSDHAIFPTYSVYVNGSLVATYPQTSVATFAAKDDTYQRVPSDIQ